MAENIDKLGLPEETSEMDVDLSLDGKPRWWCARFDILLRNGFEDIRHQVLNAGRVRLCRVVFLSVPLSYDRVGDKAKSKTTVLRLS